MSADFGALSKILQITWKYGTWHEMNILDILVAGKLNGLLNLISKLQIIIYIKNVAHVKYKY